MGEKNKIENIVFFGSSHFGLPSLTALLDAGYSVSCVVTQPDKKRGRGLTVGGTVIKEFAVKAGLPVFQPRRINEPESALFLKGLPVDLFVVIAYGQILSEQMLCIPRHCSVNVHASLLPKYRGAAPIEWALINGDASTGVTVMRMTATMDAGPVLLQKETLISHVETAVTLEDTLSHLAPEVLLEAITLMEKGKAQSVPQEEGGVTLAPRLKKEDGQIRWHTSAEQIDFLIRGCIKWPGAFTYYKGQLMKVYKATVKEVSGCQGIRVSGKPGEILQVSKDGIAVACGKGFLTIEELQLEGKRRMKAEEFIAGHKITAGEFFNPKK